VVALPIKPVAALVDTVESLRAELEAFTATFAAFAVKLAQDMVVVQLKLNKILSEVNPTYHDEKK
jgi:hypothetical protein